MFTGLAKCRIPIQRCEDSWPPKWRFPPFGFSDFRVPKCMNPLLPGSPILRIPICRSSDHARELTFQRSFTPSAFWPSRNRNARTLCSRDFRYPDSRHADSRLPIGTFPDGARLLPCVLKSGWSRFVSGFSRWTYPTSCARKCRYSDFRRLNIGTSFGTFLPLFTRT
jgi:hypothetical protein